VAGAHGRSLAQLPLGASWLQPRFTRCALAAMVAPQCMPRWGLLDHLERERRRVGVLVDVRSLHTAVSAWRASRVPPASTSKASSPYRHCGSIAASTAGDRRAAAAQVHRRDVVVGREHLEVEFFIELGEVWCRTWPMARCCASGDPRCTPALPMCCRNGFQTLSPINRSANRCWHQGAKMPAWPFGCPVIAAL
jgi:hypothetical protein